MMKCLTLFLLLAVIIGKSLCDLWQDYKQQYSKSYDDEEDILRQLIWHKNIDFIKEHNSQYDLGKYKYYLGVNEFADMTHKEFRAKYLGYKRTPRRSKSSATFFNHIKGQLPSKVNWVKKGYVTGVKNQGQCGSCWAFSTTGSVEGQHFNKTHTLKSLSEQQLVDCSDSNGNEGCNGGLMDYAFQYIEQYGIESEQRYPYTAEDGDCQYDASKVVARITGYVDVNSGDEDALAAAVATVGPISVGIDASSDSFQFYHGGVYDDDTCSSNMLDHGVLAVGYGSLGTDKYWLVKNSWGRSWGLKGYIMMSKDKDNQCGIATAASYPTV